MNTCSNCGKVAGGQSNILQGCVCQYSMQAPPQRTWQGLTAGEILDALISVDEKTVRLPSMLGQFACAIEAKLKEKNNA